MINGLTTCFYAIGSAVSPEQKESVSQWAKYMSLLFALLLLFFIVVAVMATVRANRRKRLMKSAKAKDQQIDAWSEAGRRADTPPSPDPE